MNKKGDVEKMKLKIGNIYRDKKNDEYLIYVGKKHEISYRFNEIVIGSSGQYNVIDYNILKTEAEIKKLININKKAEPTWLQGFGVVSNENKRRF